MIVLSLVSGLLSVLFFGVFGGSQPAQANLFVMPGDRVVWGVVRAPRAIEMGGDAEGRASGEWTRGSDHGSRAGEIKRDGEPMPIMLAQLAGVHAVLDAKGVAEISQCQTVKGTAPERVSEAVIVAEIELSGKSKKQWVRIYEGSDGAVYAEEAGDRVTSGDGKEGGEIAGRGEVTLRRAKLDREKLVGVAVKQGWTWPLGVVESEGLTEVPLAVAKTEVLKPPFAHGRYVIDKETMGERIFGAKGAQLPRADRVLNEESFALRLPKGARARGYPGLVVWIPPMNVPEMAGVADEAVPRELRAALDELNLLCVVPGNAGNDRTVTNRIQIALDSVSTVRARYHIDPTRVYIVGLSGGGRTASIVQGCFPDVFGGVVAICGLENYRNVPAAGRGVYVAKYLRPRGEAWGLLQNARIAAISGEKDFNYVEMDASVELLKADGLQAKMYSDAMRGHTMPPAQELAEAMRWVDATRRAERQRAEEMGEMAMQVYERTLRERPGNLKTQREDLVRVIDCAPWTSVAWRAVDLLAQMDEKQKGNGEIKGSGKP